MAQKTDLTEYIKDFALEQIGFDLVGVASANDPQFNRAPPDRMAAEGKISDCDWDQGA